MQRAPYRSDQEYLRYNQYRNSSNLNARFDLHDRFSINKYGWHRWVFDHFNFPSQSRLLELGCGGAYLWTKNQDRIPKEWDIILSDFSPGMLQDARSNLRSLNHPIRFEVTDAQSISFEEASFDGVIANQMLYHVPDRNKAFSEIYRVLKPEGRFFAATNGQSHLKELGELAQRFRPDFNPHWRADTFTLETGKVQLSQWFPYVTVTRYEDGLVITEVDGLTSWAKSWAGVAFGDKLPVFLEFLEEEFRRQGAIRVTKDSGLFEIRKCNDP